MSCTELIMATEIILKLLDLRALPQVILYAERPLVEMTIESFHLPWVVVGQDGIVTIVRRKK